jgi:hypothetical protein
VPDEQVTHKIPAHPLPLAKQVFNEFTIRKDSEEDDQMKSELSFGLLAMTWLWAGCTTAQVQATRQIHTRIETHEPVAIVVSPETTEVTSDAVGCISKVLRERFPNLRIVLPDEFHKLAFPDVALELAPRALIYLPLLLNDPAFRARITPLDLRYLISVQGKTDQKAKPFFGGAGGYGGAVTWFGAEWDRKSNVTASILDLKQDTGAGEIRASAEGKPWFVCIGLLIMCAPFGAPAFTEAKACDEIGTAVAKFLAGEGANEPSKEVKESVQEGKE